MIGVRSNIAIWARAVYCAWGVRDSPLVGDAKRSLRLETMRSLFIACASLGRGEHSPANELARDLPGGELNPIGRVLVDPWRRPAGRSNVFALGDVAATGDLMTIVAITRQAPWLGQVHQRRRRGPARRVLAPVFALAFAANSRSARSEARRKRPSAHEERPDGWRVPSLVDQGQGPFHPPLPQGVRGQIARLEWRLGMNASARRIDVRHPLMPPAFTRAMAAAAFGDLAPKRKAMLTRRALG